MSLRNLPESKRSGSWEPAAATVINVDSVSVDRAYYAVVGNQVMCFIAYTRTATGAGAYELTFTPPFGVDFDDVSDVAGVGAEVSTVPFASVISGNPISGVIKVIGSFGAGGTAKATAIFSYAVPE